MIDVNQIRSLRTELLHLHKTLVDLERADYEGKFGSVTSGQFLNLLLEDARFSWLRKISTLIVEIDEAFDAELPPTPLDRDMFMDKARELLTSNSDADFAERYQDALQRHPDVVIAHSTVVRLFKQTGSDQ